MERAATSKRRAVMVVALACSSCGADPGDAPDGFVALQRDFAGYRAWASLDVGSDALQGHPAGERVVYANRPVPAGCAWPVGSILVKEIHTDPDMRRWELFAMAKRGGSYDHNPATGWEFFTLALTAEGTPVITSRGVNPGFDVYSGSPGGGCNGCHGVAAVRAFDHVFTAAFRPRCATP